MFLYAVVLYFILITYSASASFRPHKSNYLVGNKGKREPKMLQKQLFSRLRYPPTGNCLKYYLISIAI